jgi:hypothetical protein
LVANNKRGSAFRFEPPPARKNATIRRPETVVIPSPFRTKRESVTNNERLASRTEGPVNCYRTSSLIEFAIGFASKKLSDWQTRISSFDLRPAGGRGALWTGLGASPALCIAMQRGRFTLEMTRDGQSLNEGRLSKELAADFGPRWNPEKKLIWTWASRQFVSQMRGDVEVFVRKGGLKLAEA